MRGRERARSLSGCDACDPDLLATLHLHGGGRPFADVDRLHSAIELRRTRRDGFVDRALPAGLSDELRARAHAEGAWLAPRTSVIASPTSSPRATACSRPTVTGAASWRPGFTRAARVTAW